MTTDINMSLDDIIKKNRSNKNFNARRKKPISRNNQNTRSVGNQGSGGGGGFGGPRFRNNSRTRNAARFSPYKRGDVDSAWSHDLYEDGYISKQRIGGSSEGTKITISNLEFGVTDSDLEELFMEVGPLIASRIDYDRSGRSKGTGSVVFEERTDAIRAIHQYNGVPLDGRPMKIEIDSLAPTRLIDQGRIGNFRNRRVGGNNAVGGRKNFNANRTRGGGKMMGNRRRNTANISAEQLDAELDEYRAKAV